MATTTKAPNLAKEIIRAAKKGDAARVRALLNEDGNLIGAMDTDGSTPLHCAAWKGSVEVVKVLLDAGADIHRHNENGHWGTTPLHAAAHGNQKAVAEVLITRGADVNMKNPSGRTPLAETKIHNATAVAKLLRQHGAVD